MSRADTVREAIAQLGVSLDQLDHARATLKDVDLAWVGCQGLRSGEVSGLADLDKKLTGLIANLRRLECDECGALILDHPKEGCTEW